MKNRGENDYEKEITFITDGYGYVVSQSITPGTLITSDMNLSLTLSKEV